MGVLVQLQKPKKGGSLTFEIMVSPLTLDGDSSIQKKYNPRGCDSGDFM